MMNALSSLLLLSICQLALSAPIVITREHTAQAVTVTDTYSTSTNYVTAPTVEILVSNGATFTYTLTGSTAYPEPTTFTSFFVADVQPQTALSSTTILTQPTAASITTDSTTSTEATSTQIASTIASTESTDLAQTTSAATTTYSNLVATSNVSESETSTQISAASTTGTATSTASTAASTTEDASTTSEAAATTTYANLVATSNVSEAAATSTETAQATTASPTEGSPTTASTSTVQQTSTTSSTSTSTSTTSSAAASSSSGSIGSVPSAIVYSPYNNDGSCKDYATVETDLKLISSTGINQIRVYSVDCNSLETVQPNALALGIKINQGLYFTSAGIDSIDDDVETLISYGESNGWDIIDFITVGNEAVQSGYVSVSDLIDKISSVKTKLSAAGYSGKFATSEPPVTFEENPDLCKNADIDYIGINPHAYFDQSSSAEDAGSFVKGQVEIVQQACGDSKTILVTETGYPSQGIQNGGNIPSVANQKIAIEKIMSEMSGEITILSTYNDLWKDAGTYGIEQSFGVIQLFE